MNEELILFYTPISELMSNYEPQEPFPFRRQDPTVHSHRGSTSTTAEPNFVGDMVGIRASLPVLVRHADGVRKFL
jgi:hypothetical protein